MPNSDNGNAVDGIGLYQLKPFISYELYRIHMLVLFYACKGIVGVMAMDTPKPPKNQVSHEE
jgi:hypothetical protein